MARKRVRPSPVFDPAASDPALAAACQDFLLGRWQAARDALRDSFGNWDLRTHRIRVLADLAVDRRIVETWQSAEPRNPDALVMRGVTVGQGGFIGARSIVAHDVSAGSTVPPGGVH